MTTFGRPAIPTPNALDLRVIQAGIAAARRRIEILEEAVRALEIAPNTLNTKLALLQAQVDNIVLTPGTGTVTSVSATVPSFMSVSGVPITTAGTIALSFSPQSRGEVLAGPLSGADATPNFRVLAWNYDLPLFSSMSFTSGLDGTEIIAIERYGNFYWTTLGDLSALLSSPTFTWRDAPGDTTLADSDMENGVSTSGSSGIQRINIPAGLAGNAVLIYQRGAASVLLVPASGVSLNVRYGLSRTLAGQYAPATLIQRATNDWFLSGDLAAGVSTGVAPGIGALALTGLAPTAVRGTVGSTPVGAMVLAGLAPTVTVA